MLHKNPVFLNARATALKKIERQAKEIKLEECARIKAENRRQREELKEQRQMQRDAKAKEKERLENEMALLAKEERERRKAEAAAAKRRPPVMEMVRNLEMSGAVPVTSDTQRVRRSMIAPPISSSTTSYENGHVAAKSAKNKKEKDEKRASILDEYLHLFRQSVNIKRKRESLEREDSGDSSGNDDDKSTTPTAASTSQLYMHLYDYLSSGGRVHSESVKFAVENNLPSAILRMILSRYAPMEMYRTPTGKTLIHLAAENNNHTAIPILISHWEKRQEALKLLMRSTDLLNTKDFHKRTPVHAACERGSYRALVALHKLGSGLDDRDSGGYTPIVWCACKDAPECAAYLMKQGVDGNVEVCLSTVSYRIS